VHNLRHNPIARLQDGTTLLEYRAREVTGEEKRVWWQRATAVWPAYDGYQEKATDREIPLFVLEPSD
jgi:deazaflavin-dependent oxidoreductase (nitroreductase family)